MRIVQFLHGNALGGMEKFCIDLSNELAKTHEVIVLADETFAPLCSDAVRFEPLDIERSRNDPFFLYRLYRRLRSWEPDIVHAHKQNSILMLKRLAPFLGVPFVATKHDTQRKKAFYGLDYAVVISDEVAQTVQAKQVRKIYNGIKLVRPQPLGLPGTFNFVAVGGLRYVKGFDRLIRAVATLPETVHLTIVGEGDERDALERLARELHVASRIHLVGFKENAVDYLAASDAAVIASRSEGFSLAMVEGLLYAPAIISTPVSGATEILPGTLLYEPERMAEVLRDVYANTDIYRSATAQTAARYRSLLCIEGCAEEYSRFYDTIIRDFHA